MRDGGAGYLARSLVDMPSKQAASLMAIGKMKIHLERVLGTGFSLETAGGQTRRRTTLAHLPMVELSGTAEVHSFFQKERQKDRRTLQPHRQAQAPLYHGGRRLRISVEGREENIRCYWKQLVTEVLTDSCQPLRRRSG